MRTLKEAKAPKAEIDAAVAALLAAKAEYKTVTGEDFPAAAAAAPAKKKDEKKGDAAAAAEPVAAGPSKADVKAARRAETLAKQVREEEV